ncbi:hypothetical protein D3C81_07440 [compost metagenome]
MVNKLSKSKKTAKVLQGDDKLKLVIQTLVYGIFVDITTNKLLLFRRDSNMGKTKLDFLKGQGKLLPNHSSIAVISDTRWHDIKTNSFPWVRGLRTSLKTILEGVGYTDLEEATGVDLTLAIEKELLGGNLKITNVANVTINETLITPLRGSLHSKFVTLWEGV